MARVALPLIAAAEEAGALAEVSAEIMPEPAPGNRASARGLGAPLGLMVGVPAALSLYGLLWLAASSLGVF